MNNEGLTADLVCLLEERSLPRNEAKFKEQIARFFIAGAARIDLIAKVIDLDNQIGGNNFDITNLQETANELQSLQNIGESPIAEDIQQMLLDDLLTSYQQMETSFSKHLYQFYKGFEFRSLWNVSGTLANFQRRASTAAQGTGQLQGVLELTKALQEIDVIQNRGRQCLTKFRYSTSHTSWSFDNEKNAALFDDLQKGSATLTLNISDSCSTCYNVRLLKMYVELYGNKTQEQNDTPPRVYLNVKHLSSSYFRDGTGKVKEFRQPPASSRKFEFNRFAITNTAKCNEERKKGNDDSSFCMKKDDDRFEPMCCHFLSDSPCEDVLLGAEECQSPFGTYNISIPIDKTAPCTASSSRITYKNCKDFDRSIYTKMNVWILYLYWSGRYPTGPDDARCGSSAARAKFEVLYNKPQLTLKHEA